MRKLSWIFIGILVILLFFLLYLKILSDPYSENVSILKYPYGAKSALVLTLDDLNGGYILTSCENQWDRKLDLDKAVDNQKRLMNFAKKYQIPFILFTIPDYCPKDNESIKCTKITLEENPALLSEIKDDINNGFIDLGLHSRYHYGQATPKPKEFGGGYETFSDWKYSLDLLKRLFNVDIDVWRSPGYRSPDYVHNGLNGLNASTDFRKDLLDLGINQEWDFVDNGYYGVTLNNGTGFYEVNSYLCPFWETRLSFVCWIETKLKLKTRSWNIHWPFRKNILEKTTINEPNTLNVLSLTNFSYQNSGFQAHTKHWGCLGINSYLIYFEKLLPFLDEVGINKFGGIWIAPTAKDVRKWYEVMHNKNYKTSLSEEKGSLTLKYKSLDNEGFTYFSFLINGITNASCPYLELPKNLTYGKKVVSLNQKQQILIVPIKPEWQALTLKCSPNQNQMIATTLFVDEEKEPLDLNEATILFAEYTDYNGFAINNAEAIINIDNQIYKMQNIHNRYEFNYNPSRFGEIPYTIQVSKKDYEPQQQDMAFLVIKKDF